LAYSINYKDFGDFVSIENNTIIFPKNMGVLQTDSIVINEYITINRNCFNIQNDIEINYDFELNGISINIGLESEYFYKSNLYPFSVNREEKTTLISLIKEEKGKAFYLKDNTMKNIIIFVKMEYLQNIFKDLPEHEKILSFFETKEEIKVLKSNQTDIKTKLCAYEIYNSSFETSLDTMFIQSKVLEILSYEFLNLTQNSNKLLDGMVNYSEYDIQALYKAKDILLLNMAKPPTILELSRQIKLNEFKLKYGFKKLFHNSPYNFLLEHKLHIAKELLETGNYNVSEVAFEVGYKRVYSFSDAFYKRFGIRPKELIKSKKYYY